jgi:predicted P-loop ATPase
MSEVDVIDFQGSRAMRSALAYAERFGWHVFPVHCPKLGGCSCGRPDCGAVGKHPRTPKGCLDASTDQATIRAWWAKWPDAGVAIATGRASGLVVLDVDPRNGGDDTLGELIAKHGQLPETVSTITGSGGAHYLFRYPAGVERVKSRAVGRGLDCKADGGYVVAAPSLHASGRNYHWEVTSQPGDVEVAELPAWLLELVSDRQTSLPAAEAGPVGEVALSLLGQAFHAAGLWVRAEPDGQRARVKCPWDDQHTGGKPGDGSTVIFGAKAGSGIGWFHCSHSHCTGRTMGDVMEKLGAEPMERGRAAAVALGVDVTSSEDDWKARLLKNDEGKLRANGANATTIFSNDRQWSGVLAFDELAGEVYKVRPPPWHPDDMPSSPSDLVGEWTDHDTARANNWLAREYHLTMSEPPVGRAIQIAADRRKIHPVRDYFDALTWDGTPRIDTWLETYLGADGPADYLSRVGSWWLISAVARTYHPGCKADCLLILEGPQGIGKSTAARILAGNWFSDTTLDLGNKDAYIALRGRLIVELAELAGISKAETDRIKAFLSSQADYYRPPYAARNVEFARRCVFIGTTNAVAYVLDETGARRIWPVRCTRVGADDLRRDRDQLWAEAVQRYRTGSRWYPLDAEEVVACRNEQDERSEVDEWDAKIALWLRRENRTETTVGEILQSVIGLPIERWSRADQTRVGRIMTRAGWTLSRPRVSGVRVSLYSAPEASQALLAA